MRAPGMELICLPRRAAGLAVVVAGLGLAGGCSRPGPPRYPVSGSVTYAGSPLASGRISFEPDTSRTNQGPGGYGDIVAGRYETYRTMGVVGGPHRVVIEGYAGDTPEERLKRRPLFPPYITMVDLPTGKAEVDFDVPSAPAR
jgi:hypothetical protein